MLHIYISLQSTSRMFFSPRSERLKNYSYFFSSDYYVCDAKFVVAAGFSFFSLFMSCFRVTLKRKNPPPNVIQRHQGPSSSTPNSTSKFSNITNADHRFLTPPSTPIPVHFTLVTLFSNSASDRIARDSSAKATTPTVAS